VRNPILKRAFSIVTLLIIFFIPHSAQAGSLANEKLLEILEQKGFLTKEEVASVKELITEEEQKEVEVVYDDGFRMRTKDRSFETRLGGRVQTDLKVFGSGYPEDNDFDIRRARVLLEGKLFTHFGYKLQAELQGSSSNRLVDAYMNFNYFTYLRFQIGQFKEPFSIENLSSSNYLVFNERSFGYWLTPPRDIGFMLTGTLFKDSINYGVGIFNGDGRDATRRSQKDDKQITSRFVGKPFNCTNISFLKGLQLGGSFSYARLDTSDLNISVRTPGLTEFFSVNSRAKYHIVYDVDHHERFGFELAYTFGPLLLMGEYVQNDYFDVLLSNGDSFDFDIWAWYASALFMITGEKPIIEGGVLKQIVPRKPFNIAERGWGAWGIGFRYQRFEADPKVYDKLVERGNSIRRAYAFTIALNWYLNSMMRINFDYSETRFSDDLFLGTHPRGYSYYEDREQVWVTRFQLEF
jgi:phosphate-selective porin OprO/OprP